MKNLSLIGILILLIFPTLLYAVTPPLYLHVGDITSGLDRPLDIAIDSAGNIYVTQGSKDEVTIFSRKGIKIGSIHIPSPTSVAVGGGYLYIGSREGYVSAYTTSGDFIKKIWQKDSHSHRPAGIAVSGTSIFISDSKVGVIDVVDFSGNQLMQIDSVDRPMGMFISGNALYVVDLALNNGGYQGAEIKVYDLSGNLINRFGSFGGGEGKFAFPFDIVVDDTGRVYVSDSHTAGIQVLDTTGTFLTAIYDSASPLSSPKGLAMAPDGRLFVVSMMDSKIQIYGIDDYTYLTVFPSNLTIDADVGVPVSPVTLTIGNEGVGTLTYNITSSEPWVIIANPSGAVAGGSSVNIDISADITSLTPGQYTATLTVVDDSGITETVDVILNLSGPIGGGCTDRIVATLDDYDDSAVTIKIVDNNGNTLQEISLEGMSDGIDTAVSDINGDGKGEIIAGSFEDSSEVLVFSPQGSEVISFSAFDEDDGKVMVYGSDIDKDGRGEIIVTGGKKSGNLKVFVYDGSGFINTGIDFKPYTKDIKNLRVASGDIDGDGNIELVTVAKMTEEEDSASKKKKGSILKIWDIDTSQGVGNWQIVQSGEQSLGDKDAKAVAVEDINGDGIKDILIATKDGLAGIVNGQLSLLFSKKDIKDMETGDINGDGVREIVLGMNNGQVSIFTIDGVNTGNISVFNTDSSVRVSAGCLGY